MSDLPPGWAETTLGEIAEVKLGRQRSPKNHTGSNMRPYLRAANVTWSGLSLDDVKEMNFTPEEVGTFRLRAGDVLVAEASGSASEVGKPAIWRDEIGDCCFQNTLLRVRSRGPLPQFLLHLLGHDARSGRLGDAARGVGIHHIGAQRLTAWRVSLPPLNEQARIVAAIEEQFSRLDAAEASLRRAAAQVPKLRAAVLDKMLASSDEWLSLGVCARVESKLVDPAEYPEMPHVAPNHIETQSGRLSGVRTVAEDGMTSSKYLFRSGDVLYSKIRPYLAKAVVAPFDGLCSADMYPLTTDLEPRFLALWMISPTFTLRAVEHQGRSVLPKINRRDLFRLPVPAFSSDEQRRIVAEVERQLSIANAMEAAIDSALARSAQLRRSILDRAFRGTLVPQDPSDEPASVLLDRIRAEREVEPKPRRKRARS
jgi:type I restriction enzyme S subunit